MAAVFKELVIEWKGKEYRITPTMRLINRIEQEVSLSDIAQRILSGKPPLSHVAVVVSLFLNSAGAKVDSEEVFHEILTSGSDAAGEMIRLILEVVFPQMGKDEAPVEEDQKAPAAPEPVKKKKK